MIRFFFVLLPLFLVSGKIFAQKFGYIDTNYILQQMPEYKTAQADIDQLSESWQREIQQMYLTIDEQYSLLKAEEVLLTEEMKRERLDLIRQKEEEAKEYHNKVFGLDGLFFLKKRELMKPVQDMVFEATQKVCKNQRLQVMFDKAGDMVMIYTDPVHDYTDYVLEELGLGDDNDRIK